MQHADIPSLMQDMGRRARAAAARLAQTPTADKNRALTAMARSIRAHAATIGSANEKDLAEARRKGLSPAMTDRLTLNDSRIAAMAAGIDDIARMDDPIGAELARWTRPNGLDISRVRTPLGVIGIIYESRPNVTADAGALCLKAGNAAILRGGSESHFSSMAILQCLREGLEAAGLPGDAIQMVPVTDRAAVGEMLTLTEFIDVIVPRGGKSLIERVSQESRIPLFKHLEGICHSYVHAAADLDKALSIVLNAKMRRTGICGATETVLIDSAIAESFLPPIVGKLLSAGCTVRGDDVVQATDARVEAATEDDWRTEYLDAIVAIRTVVGLEDAIAHIATYGSSHTDAIITEDTAAAERFFAAVDSAIVMHNASTQFADGGEFGMGAEIGISTGKLHARGPIGAEQLTSFKYLVRGDGQIRPA